MEDPFCQFLARERETLQAAAFTFDEFLCGLLDVTMAKAAERFAAEADDLVIDRRP
jgi:hypothetical protein